MVGFSWLFLTDHCGATNMEPDRLPIRLSHNLDGRKFKWLWAKYVRATRDTAHCTGCLLGPYSHRLSGHNSELRTQGELVLDEEPPGTYGAVYICGVARQGYSRKQNYAHNLHAAIVPAA